MVPCSLMCQKISIPCSYMIVSGWWPPTAWIPGTSFHLEPPAGLQVIPTLLFLSPICLFLLLLRTPDYIGPTLMVSPVLRSSNIISSKSLMPYKVTFTDPGIRAQISFGVGTLFCLLYHGYSHSAFLDNYLAITPAS